MIKGLDYIPSFIKIKEEAELIQRIDSHPWSMDLKRRTQHYGYKYDYTKKIIDPSMFVGSIPDWLAPYCLKLMELGFKSKPDQVIINEYLPGQGIAKHVDCVPCFGDVVASLSLGSACAMDFEHVDSHKSGSTMLGPRSILILSGPARFEWMHSIPARKEDLFDGEPLPRGRRISLTFRTVKLDLL